MFYMNASLDMSMGFKGLKNILHSKDDTEELVLLREEFNKEYHIGSKLILTNVDSSFKTKFEFLTYDYNGAITTFSFDIIDDPRLHMEYVIDDIRLRKDHTLSILLHLC